MKKLTPVLCVDAIEPSLRFWVDSLGFEKTVEIPEGDKLGFVALTKGNVEVMYQSRASLEKDVPAIAASLVPSRVTLYLEIDDFDDVVERIAGYEVVVPKRIAPYGATEIGVKEPAGNIVMFAHFAAPAEA